MEKPTIIQFDEQAYKEYQDLQKAVLIKETNLENWGSAGQQHSIKFKDLKI